MIMNGLLVVETWQAVLLTPLPLHCVMLLMHRVASATYQQIPMGFVLLPCSHQRTWCIQGPDGQSAA